MNLRLLNDSSLFFFIEQFLKDTSVESTNRQIYKSGLYEVCKNLYVEPIDIIKYIKIHSRAR